jgi:erythritol transport system permease protein
VMLGVSEFWQMVIKGFVIVAAVAIDQLQSRLQAKFLPLLLSSEPGDSASRGAAQ